jgi:hypothetical protein
MGIVPKLLVLLAINLAALAFLIYKLFLIGNPFPKALHIAWNMIMVRGRRPDYSILREIPWAPLLAYTWWMVIFLFLGFWVGTQERYLTLIVGLLVVLHAVWYLSAVYRGDSGFDRTFHLNSDWGIIYQTVGADSDLNQKSLAELDLRKKNLLVLAVERRNQLAAFPKGTEILEAGDRLVIFGDLSSSRQILN